MASGSVLYDSEQGLREQGAQTGALRRAEGWAGGRREGGLGARGHGCTMADSYCYERKPHNSVRQLSFN